MVGGLPKEKRADAIRACRRRVAVALQTGIAKQIHSAEKPAALSEEVSYVARRPLDPIVEENEEANEAERLLALGRAMGAAGG